jgi:serine/threonine-protein kinase
MGIETTQDLVATLRDLGLLDSCQLAELSPAFLERCPNAMSLGEQLVERQQLTAFQLHNLLQGKGCTLLIGSYVLLAHLAAGGMGEVFVARHRRMQRVVALKVIRRAQLADGNTVERFRREAQAVAQLSHPNIVSVYDAGEEADAHYLAMELIDGIDLGKLIHSCGQLPVPLACDFIRQAALGLHHAHQRGFVHRDIKPHNLLVAPRGGMPAGERVPPLEWFFGGKVKILDLGLVRLLNPSGQPGDDPLTRQGIVIGTADYLAPEQARDSRGVDHRADIYSLGCTLYHLLAGLPPFHGGLPLDKLLRHQADPPPRLTGVLSDIPGELEQALQRMMAKRPEDRFASAAEVARALTPLAGTLAAATPVILNPSPRPPFPDYDFLSPTRPMAAPPLELAPSPGAPAQGGEAAGVASSRRGVRKRWLFALAGSLALLVVGLAAICWPRASAPSPPDSATALAAAGYEPDDCAGAVEINVQALKKLPPSQERVKGLVEVLRPVLLSRAGVDLTADIEHVRLVWKEGDAANPVVLARCRPDRTGQPAPPAQTAAYSFRLPPYLVFSSNGKYVAEAMQKIRTPEGRHTSSARRRFAGSPTSPLPLLWLDVSLDRLGDLPNVDNPLEKVLQLAGAVEGSVTCTEKEMSGALHFTPSSPERAAELEKALNELRSDLKDADSEKPPGSRPPQALVQLARGCKVKQSDKGVRVELRLTQSGSAPSGVPGGSTIPGE